MANRAAIERLRPAASTHRLRGVSAHDLASSTRVAREGGALPAVALAGARTGVGDGTTDGRQGLRWLVLPIRTCPTAAIACLGITEHSRWHYIADAFPAIRLIMLTHEHVYIIQRILNPSADVSIGSHRKQHGTDFLQCD